MLFRQSLRKSREARSSCTAKGDDIPIKYSPKYRKLVVVDAPDVRGREGGTFMLYIWGLAVIFIAVFIMTLIASL